MCLYSNMRFPLSNSRNLLRWALRPAKLFQKYSFGRLKKCQLGLGRIAWWTSVSMSRCAKSFCPCASFWGCWWGPHCWSRLLVQFVSSSPTAAVSFHPGPMLCRPQDATENEERESQRVNSTFAGGCYLLKSKMGKGRVKTFVAVVCCLVGAHYQPLPPGKASKQKKE